MKLATMDPQSEIADLIDQLRFPRTAKMRKEIPAVVAELVAVYDRLARSEGWRNDWIGIREPVPC